MLHEYFGPVLLARRLTMGEELFTIHRNVHETWQLESNATRSLTSSVRMRSFQCFLFASFSQEIHKLNSELDTSTRQLWQDLTETQDERSQLLARVMDLGMKSIFTVFCEHYVLHASTYMCNVVQPHSRPLQFLGIGRN